MDVFRALAVLSVVIYHFTYLPYGYLGVDLFFVISGLLVGSILIRQYKEKEKISFSRFVLRRGFKIWPSYFFFLLAGTLFVYLVYRNDRPNYQIEGLVDWLRYIFFYRNYNDVPYHWVFDHSWTLCIEEHFYIILPVLFLIIQAMIPGNFRILLWSIIGLIAVGMIVKIAGYENRWIRSSHTATHSRIDALGWGVLLGALITYHGEKLKKWKWLPVLFIAGLLLFSAGLLIHAKAEADFFNVAIFPGFIPFCFSLMIAGLYFIDFSGWKTVRFISYYSYNWYLWHPMLIWLVIRNFGKGAVGLLLFLVISFLTAMVFTILIEEKFLSIRETVLKRRSKKRAIAKTA